MQKKTKATKCLIIGGLLIMGSIFTSAIGKQEQAMNTTEIVSLEVDNKVPLAYTDGENEESTKVISTNIDGYEEEVISSGRVK